MNFSAEKTENDNAKPSTKKHFNTRNPSLGVRRLFSADAVTKKDLKREFIM